MAEDEIVRIAEEPLTTAGFVESGLRRYRAAVTDYARELLKRSVASANVDKAEDSPLEVTHNHVRDAVKRLATLPRETPGRWSTAAEVGDRVAFAVAAAGASHLDNTIGIVAFGIGLLIGGVLVMIKLIRNGPR